MSVRIAVFLALAVCTATCALAAPRQRGMAAPAQPSTEAGARAVAYVRAHAADLGATAADLEDVVVSSETVSASSGVTHVYLRQRYRGTEINTADVTVNIARDGRVLNAVGTFFRNLAASVNRPGKTLDAGEAVARAATYVDVTLAAGERRKIPAKLVYHPVTPGTLRLAWQVEIETPDAQHGWVLTVDAVSGALLHKYDRVVSDQERTECEESDISQH
jgi:Zn-dependent metalloprotease